MPYICQGCHHWHNNPQYHPDTPENQSKMPSILVLAVFLALQIEAKIPEYKNTKICNSKDPNLTKCIEESINLLKPKLRSGIQELDVPPMEPLVLDTITLKENVNANLTDIRVSGVSSFCIKDINVNLAENQFLFKITIPKLSFIGNYVINTNILFWNINGNGPIHGNITNYYVEGLLLGYRIKQKGVEYLKFLKLKLKVRFGPAQLRLENLFNGDPILGEVTNALINDNSNVFLDEIRPALENALSEKLVEIANNIVLKFTYKDLFP